MKHFACVLYVAFDAQKNLCDKQNVSLYGTPVESTDRFRDDRTIMVKQFQYGWSDTVTVTHSVSLNFLKAGPGPGFLIFPVRVLGRLVVVRRYLVSNGPI